MKKLTSNLAVLVALIALSFTSCKKDVYTDGWETNLKEYPQSLTGYLAKGNEDKLELKIEVILRAESIKDNKLKKFQIYTFVDDNLNNERVLFEEFSDVGLDKTKYSNLTFEQLNYLKAHVIYRLKYNCPLTNLGLNNPATKPLNVIVIGNNGVEFNEIIYTDK